jgi:hypothetical protein
MVPLHTQIHKKAGKIPLRCAQINLQHSKTATDNFNQLMMETAKEIAFIQELYIYQNQVTGISRNHRIFACGNGRKRSTIVIANKSIDALLISQLSE